MNDDRPPFLIRIIPGVQVFVLVGAAIVASLYFRPVVGLSWLDGVFFILFLALLGWCFVPRYPAIDADGHESTRQSLAFRLGQKLNHVLYRGRRNPPIRD